jgi:ferrous iron transport protein A
MTLKEIKVGQWATVIQINAIGPLKRRIMDMGITKGAKIKVVKYAPMGDPIELCLRNYILSIRKSEAELIVVSKTNEN